MIKKELNIIQLEDGRRLMPLVNTRLVGTQIVEEASGLFGLYEEQAPGSWQRIDGLEYAERWHSEGDDI